MEQAHGNAQAMEDASDKMWGAKRWTKEGSHQIEQNRKFRDAALTLANKNHERRYPTGEINERFAGLDLNGDHAAAAQPKPRKVFGTTSQSGAGTPRGSSDPQQLASDLRSSGIAVDLGKSFQEAWIILQN